jgi:drug/metabolite transporter (DMT)-like permease
MTAAVSAVLLKERSGPAARIALPIGLIGTIWVIVRGNPAALLSLELGAGDAIFFAATVALGIYGPLVKYLHRGEPMAQMTLWTLVTGAFWLLLLSASRLFEVKWDMVSPTVYGGIAYLAVFSTLVRFFAIQWSSTVIGPTKAVSYTYLNPILVLIMGMALGEGDPPGRALSWLLADRRRDLCFTNLRPPQLKPWRAESAGGDDFEASGIKSAFFCPLWVTSGHNSQA